MSKNHVTEGVVSRSILGGIASMIKKLKKDIPTT